MADSQIAKAVASGSYFIIGSLAIVASQFLGAPLYLVNEDWYNAWIALTKQSFGLLTMTVTQCWAPTVVRVSGDKSVRGQLLPLVGGGLLCDFPERMVMMANHQIYTDWLYLWWIAYTNGMHGRIYIVLKESLRRIPVIGWGMQLSQFIFLKRKWENDKPHLAAHLQKLNKPTDPMWLVLFPEGTNLASCTRQKSAEWAAKQGINDMRNLLLPRYTGLQFCLQQLHKSVDYVYDCTIAYEGVSRGQYAQDIFTIQSAYFQSKPPKSVNMYWRRFAVSSIPLNDPKAFELWLRARWMEKDALIDMYLRTGRFPADQGVDKTADGTTRRGAGYIETEIKAFHWYEFLQVFAPIGLFALILYTFYGALPGNFVKFFNRPAILDKVRIFQKQIMGTHKKLLTGPEAKAWSNEMFRLKKAAANITSTSTKPLVRKAITNGTISPPRSITGTSNSSQLAGRKHQSQTVAKPKQSNVGQVAKPAPKKLEVKPTAKPAPKKLGPKKLEVKPKPVIPVKKKPAVAMSSKLPPPKLAPKKPVKDSSAKSDTSSVPKKLEIKQSQVASKPKEAAKPGTSAQSKKPDTKS
ncbi:hypothetical protein MMC30_006539 [Trapelia coarctata]|nr:hypothetical protein [Trapelia coarctata]